MITVSFRCPHCENISTYSGEPGEKKIIICPICNNKGKITFPETMRTGEPAIEVTKLTKTYGDLTAVNSISFTVYQGEIFAFLGPNGAGKTTTVEMIEAIRKPTAGSIRILNEDISTHFNDVKNQIGILPQEFHSYERLTVRETLDYFSKLYKKHANIDTIIQAMDLQSHQHQQYRNLSGGLKQRVGVAIALVNDPEIVFLDEPSTGLDPKARREVWNVIANLKKKGKTVFLTTHYMEEAEYLADHIAIIHQGNIIAEGTLEELTTKYGRGDILHIKNCKTTNTKQLLVENGYEVKQETNGDLAIVINYKDRVLEVLSLLRRECIEYSSIDISRSNLEEVFLYLTGSRLTEDSNS